MNRLEETEDYGQPKKPHEVKDIGFRHLHLLRPPHWDKSIELMSDQLRNYPAGDIHIPLNVAATAACGLSVEDNNVQHDAFLLLEQYQEAAQGYLRSETSFELLRLTPQLPKNLRPAWTRFALYENTADERDSPRG